MARIIETNLIATTIKLEDFQDTHLPSVHCIWKPLIRSNKILGCFMNIPYICKTKT
jgi:hypothetical protein